MQRLWRLRRQQLSQLLHRGVRLWRRVAANELPPLQLPLTSLGVAGAVGLGVQFAEATLHVSHNTQLAGCCGVCPPALAISLLFLLDCGRPCQARCKVFYVLPSLLGEQRPTHQPEQTWQLLVLLLAANTGGVGGMGVARGGVGHAKGQHESGKGQNELGVP